MPATTLRIIILPLLLFFAGFPRFHADASGPIAPQPQQQAGQPINLEVDAHGSLFVDPLWSSGAQGTCRYLTNPSASEWFVPIESQAEWQSMETSNDNQYSENYATQQVCCRPSTGTQNATLCASSSGGAQSAQIVGPDPTGYGLLGSTGSATATCSNPPYGSYAETQTFTCILDPSKPSSGVGADGAWSTETGDANTCQPNAYTTYGGCSVTCGGGNIYETVYNSCGQITSQGYSGPSCNTQSCCTPSYTKSCSTSTAIYTDVSCGTGSYSISGGCTSFSCVVGGSSCSAGSRTTIISEYEYFDCGNTWVSWGQQTGCVVDGYDYETDYGPPNFTQQIYVNAGPDHETCYGTCWE